MQRLTNQILSRLARKTYEGFLAAANMAEQGDLSQEARVDMDTVAAELIRTYRLIEEVIESELALADAMIAQRGKE